MSYPIVSSVDHLLLFDARSNLCIVTLTDSGFDRK